MSTYNIQQTVHLFQLPTDITNIINSYLFYDKITGETRKKMRDIVETFRFACQTRERSYINDEDTNEEFDEHWGVWMADIRLEHLSDSPEIQFQATNCSICGGYKTIGSDFDIPHRALCNCEHR